jgi:hypothetical protein
MLDVICNKDHTERNFCKAINSNIIATSVTGPAASVHGLMLSVFYRFNMGFATFLNSPVLNTMSSLNATYSLVTPPYLRPVMNLI